MVYIISQSKGEKVCSVGNNSSYFVRLGGTLQYVCYVSHIVKTKQCPGNLQTILLREFSRRINHVLYATFSIYLLNQRHPKVTSGRMIGTELTLINPFVKFVRNVRKLLNGCCVGDWL